MDNIMSNRVFITGGSSGLGKALALKFCREGYRVCIGDINDVRGREAEGQLQAISAEALYQHCDVTQVKDLEAVDALLKQQWGGVDVVINNAGIAGSSGPIEKIELTHWTSTVDINFLGVVRGCQVFTDTFKRQGNGYFINIASGGGYLNAPFLSTYNTTKAGVISLSETLAAEFYGENIHVSVVCPGFFHTNLTETMHSHFEGLQDKVNRMMEENKVSADIVADKVFRAYTKRRFLVLPHLPERLLWHFKRLWPRGFAAVMRRHGRKLFEV